MKRSDRQNQLKFALARDIEEEQERRRLGLSVQRIPGNLLICECACT
jgi:hypothetical protein